MNSNEWTSYNQTVVKCDLTRIELCNILIALTCAEYESGAEKWNVLHARIRGILDTFDEMNNAC